MGVNRSDFSLTQTLSLFFFVLLNRLLCLFAHGMGLMLSSPRMSIKVKELRLMGIRTPQD